MSEAMPLPAVAAYGDLVRDFLLPKVPPSEFFSYFDELALKVLPEDRTATGVTEEALLRILSTEGVFAFMLTEKVIDMTVLRAWFSAYSSHQIAQINLPVHQSGQTANAPGGG